MTRPSPFSKTASDRIVCPVPDQGTDLQRALDLPIDTNGSPVTLQPVEWLVCFVPGLQKQWWHRFVPGFQHVFLIRCINHEQWVLFEPWWSRLLVSVLDTEQALRFLRWADAGAVLLAPEAIPGKGSQFHGWSNCAVLAGFLLGRNYRLLSPNTLYKRLAAEDTVRKVEVADVLQTHFAHLVVAAVDEALGPVERLPAYGELDARGQLAVLADHMLTGLRSPRLAMAYRIAQQEAVAFPVLASTFYEQGTRRALILVERALRAIVGNRPADGSESAVAARAFLDLLHDEAARHSAASSPSETTGTRPASAMVDRFLRELDGHVGAAIRPTPHLAP